MTAPDPATTAQVGCRDIVDRLSDYLDRELDQPTAALVQRHLAACAPCARLARELAAVVRALGRLGASWRARPGG